MKVALLVGPCPPGECGVGDYVVLLAQALNAVQVKAEIIEIPGWNIRKAVATHVSLSRKDFDIIQLHYPSLIGAKLGPQVNSLLRRCVISLHEGSRMRILRKLALIPFSFYPKHIIFFNEYERTFGVKWAPWLSGKSSVIQPPSNIRRFPYDGPRDLSEIVSFGLIRPGNGHDKIIKLGALIKASGLRLRIRVIGSPQTAKFISFFAKLRAESADLPIIWDSGLSEENVAKKLAAASIAYLPYPTGAAELRSSLKAAMLNGLAVITTHGTQTPKDLHGVVKFCNTPEQALSAIRVLLDNTHERVLLSQRAMSYVKDWTWERCAVLHAELYSNLTNQQRSRTVANLEEA